MATRDFRAAAYWAWATPDVHLGHRRGDPGVGLHDLLAPNCCSASDARGRQRGQVARLGADPRGERGDPVVGGGLGLLGTGDVGRSRCRRTGRGRRGRVRSGRVRSGRRGSGVAGDARDRERERGDESRDRGPASVPEYVLPSVLHCSRPALDKDSRQTLPARGQNPRFVLIGGEATDLRSR